MTIYNDEGRYDDVKEKRINAILKRPLGQWFLTRDCTKIAADTFKRPIAMYSKKGTHLFLPYRTPPSQANWVHPFVLQLMNSHFILVKIRENVSFPWPDVEPYRPKYVTHDMPQDSWYPHFWLELERTHTPHQGLPMITEDPVYIVFIQRFFYMRR